MHALASGIVLLALLAIGGVGGLLAVVGCSENLDPGSERENVCNALTRGELAWWLAVLWPAALFGASLLVPALRRRSILVGLATVGGALVFWIPLMNTISG